MGLVGSGFDIMRGMTSTVGICACAISIAVIGIGSVGCERKKIRDTRIPICYDNLRNIEVCKFWWEANEGKSTNDIPKWEDLRPYFPDRWSNAVPICPNGGSYIINPIGSTARCSVGGDGHELGY